MTIEAKDLLAYLGIEAKEDTTLDAVKAAFDAKYLQREKAIEDAEINKAITGKVVAEHAKAIKRKAKDHAIEFDATEADKPVHELIAILLDKKSATFNEKIAELEKKVTAPSDALKDIEAKLTQAQLRADAEAKAKADLAEKLTAKETEFVTFQKTFKLNNYRDTLMKSLPFSDTATPLMRKGFESLVAEKFIIDLDDKGEAYIADAATKARIADPSKHGAYLTPDQVLKAELQAEKLLKVVDPKQPTPPPVPQKQNEFTPSGVRRAHPLAGG